jgi:hypothetical protein
MSIRDHNSRRNPASTWSSRFDAAIHENLFFWRNKISKNKENFTVIKWN